MHGPNLSDLTDRAREIFRLVVEGYIASGQPMGSKALAGPGGVNLSPASIRSVLQELQDAGLLAAPHTSAGRMPTEVGLRLFVDGIMQVAEPTVAERAQIERGLAHGGTIENALAAASSALSELSAGAAVVMVPKREPRLVQISFVPLSPVRALAVLVSEDGGIENRVIELPEPAGASACMAGHLARHRGWCAQRLLAVGRPWIPQALTWCSAVWSCGRRMLPRGR